MARKMAIVPISWLEAMKKEREPEEPPIRNEIVKIEQRNDDKIDIINLFPKNIRSKARIMLHHIKNLKLDDNNRVIYANHTIGSNIFDLVKYFVSDINFAPAKPLDADIFKTSFLLNVPKSAFGRGRLSDAKNNWRQLYK